MRYLELNATLVDEATNESLGADLASHCQHDGRHYRNDTKQQRVLIDVHVENLREEVDLHGCEQEGIDEEEETVRRRQPVVRIDIQALPVDIAQN